MSVSDERWNGMRQGGLPQVPPAVAQSLLCVWGCCCVSRRVGLRWWGARGHPGGTVPCLHPADPPTAPAQPGEERARQETEPGVQADFPPSGPPLWGQWPRRERPRTQAAEAAWGVGSSTPPVGVGSARCWLRAAACGPRGAGHRGGELPRCPLQPELCPISEKIPLQWGPYSSLGWRGSPGVASSRS